jgi:hypothetical protein
MITAFSLFWEMPVSIQRVVLLALVSMTAISTSGTAHAATRHKASHPTAPTPAPEYSLRIHIYSELPAKGAKHGYHVSQWNGRANLMDGDDTRGMAYRSTCKSLSPMTDEGQEYDARWVRRGQLLQIQMTGDASAKTCSLGVTMLKTAFAVENGKVVVASGKVPDKVVDKAAGKTVAAKSAKPLRPADLNPAHYPLEVAVLSMRRKDAPGPVAGATATPAPVLAPVLGMGLGQGNLQTEHGLEAVDFTTACPSSIDPNREGEFYRARWRDEGKWMQILLVTPGSGPTGVCDLTTTLRPEVYIRQPDGPLKTISQDAYKKLLRDEATVLSRY